MIASGHGLTTVFPCAAAADRSIAARIASFLEAGGDARVFLAEGESGRTRPARQGPRGANCEVILVLFSHHCALPPGTRSQWERVLVEEPKANGVRVGVCSMRRLDSAAHAAASVRLPRPCPSGLRKFETLGPPSRRHMASPGRRGACRAPAELDDIGSAVADRPGVQSTGSAALAYAFVRAYAEDFDEVFRLECAGRTPAAVAGDLACKSVWAWKAICRVISRSCANSARLAAFWYCSKRPKATMPDCSPSGKLFHADGCRIGADGAPHAAESLRAIQAKFAHPGGDWLELCRLARIGRRVARDQNRIAELYELLREWHALAMPVETVISWMNRRQRWSGCWRLGPLRRGRSAGTPPRRRVWRTDGPAFDEGGETP